MNFIQLANIVKIYNKIAFILCCVLTEIVDEIGIEKPQINEILLPQYSTPKKFVYKIAKKINTPKKSLENPEDISQYLYKRIPQFRTLNVSAFEGDQFFFIEISNHRKGGDMV